MLIRCHAYVSHATMTFIVHCAVMTICLLISSIHNSRLTGQTVYLTVLWSAALRVQMTWVWSRCNMTASALCVTNYIPCMRLWSFSADLACCSLALPRPLNTKALGFLALAAAASCAEAGSAFLAALSSVFFLAAFLTFLTFFLGVLLAAIAPGCCSRQRVLVITKNTVGAGFTAPGVRCQSQLGSPNLEQFKTARKSRRTAQKRVCLQSQGGAMKKSVRRHNVCSPQRVRMQRAT